MELTFSAFLTSSVVAGLVAGLIALRSSERKIQIENVTQERAKWREKIRSKALEVKQAAIAGNTIKISELHLEFSLNLNPLDKEDVEILKTIAALKNNENKDTKLVELSDRLSLLLKHDWDRAKHEAKPWFLLCKPERVSYAKFKVQRKVEQSSS